MSKRHKKSKLNVSSDYDEADIYMAEDLYETPKGKKPKGKQKRKQANHKTAYYD